jgi:hypothetical protein
MFAIGCHRGETGTAPDPTTTGTTSEGGQPPSEPGHGYPGELIDTSEMGASFMARQKLAGRFGEQEFRFEAVLQLHGGKLTVLGLTPFGTKAFVLVQTGTEVEFTPLIDREIPFPPEYMLQDIHRAWLWHTRLPWGAQAPSEDPASVEVAGERVTERWRDGALVQRSFERLDGQPPGEIRIEYSGGSGHPAKHVILDNGWFGYRLEIETTDWRALNPDP